MRSERKSPGLGDPGLWSCLNRWSDLWGVQPHGNRTMQKRRLPGQQLVLSVAHRKSPAAEARGFEALRSGIKCSQLSSMYQLQNRHAVAVGHQWGNK
jgi:hypothetical protein